MGAIYVFHGEDDFALADARRALEQSLLDPAWREFNLTVLAGDTPPGRLIEQLLAMPFGGGKRLVVVKDAALLTSREAGEALEPLLETGLPEHAALLLTGSKLDGRLKLVKKLLAMAEVREFGKAKPWQLEEQLAPWVEAEVNRRKRRIAPDAARLLIQSTLGDRWRMTHEIDKLTTYAPESARIDVAMVKTLLSSGEVEVFALTDALARKRADEALDVLARLLDGEHALKVLAAVVTILRGWLRLKRLAARGMSASAIAQALGQRSDFKIRKDLELLRAWSVPELEKALEQLFGLDAGIKSGNWAPEHHHLLWEKTLATMLGQRV
ncbi:MAG TPA: DNA polymerase III subunit delta [Oscillatoriaceae cyanobacterium]